MSYFSKQEYEDQSMSNEYSYSRGRPPAESISRIADWDINDSIIPRVNFEYIYIYMLSNNFTFFKILFIYFFLKKNHIVFNGIF